VTQDSYVVDWNGPNVVVIIETAAQPGAPDFQEELQVERTTAPLLGDTITGHVSLGPLSTML
jgi:hypothetical protein